jgi:hypothetical protein
MGKGNVRRLLAEFTQNSFELKWVKGCFHALFEFSLIITELFIYLCPHSVGGLGGVGS